MIKKLFNRVKKYMEDTKLYRPILKEAFRIVKNFKHLWFFGLFAALLGAGGEYEILTRAIYRQGNDPGFLTGLMSGWSSGIQNGLSNGGNFWNNAFVSIVSSPPTLIFISVIILLMTAIGLFFLWLAIVSQIGIINNTNLISKNKATSVNEGIDFAVKNFWPVAIINVLLKIIIFILFLILGWELVLLSSQGIGGVLIYYISFVLFMLAIFIISFILKYQIFYILFNKQKMSEAFKSALALFKNNWLISLELALVLFVIYLVAIFINSFIVATFVAMPFVIGIYYGWAIWLAGLISLVGLIVMFILTVTIMSVTMAYQWAAWTLLFNRLNQKTEAISKIDRGSKQVIGYLMKK